MATGPGASPAFTTAMITKGHTKTTQCGSGSPPQSCQDCEGSTLARSAPTRQIMCVGTARQLGRPFHGVGKFRFDANTSHPPAQEIGPQEFAERRRILGEGAGAPQFPCKAAKWVVLQPENRFRQLGEFAPPSLPVVRVDPRTMVQDNPERVNV